MNLQQQRRLLQLLWQPTAPFREDAVVAFVQTLFQRRKVPHFLDPAGNLVVGFGSPEAYRQRIQQKSREPLRLFIAHMDHPGFHGMKWLSPVRLLVKWHGGSPTRHLRGSRLWLANNQGYSVTGKLERPRLLASGHALDQAVVRLDKPLHGLSTATDYFGGFRFRSPAWCTGSRIYTKAADDLVGVFAIVETALRLFSKNRRAAPNFIGLLTRGEEVGFTGAIAHFELGWLHAARRPVLAISLETSRALPNAVLGHGPVIRLGDRRTVFDPDGLRVLTDLAEKLLPGQHQRRVMDGGTCEATAATAWGLPAIGISIPLGNYHNEKMDTVPDAGRRVKHPRNGGPAPEVVHRDDISGMLTLCRGLLEPGLPWRDPWQDVRKRLRANFRRYQSELCPRPGQKG